MGYVISGQITGLGITPLRKERSPVVKTRLQPSPPSRIKTPVPTPITPPRITPPIPASPSRSKETVVLRLPAKAPSPREPRPMSPRIVTKPVAPRPITPPPITPKLSIDQIADKMHAVLTAKHSAPTFRETVSHQVKQSTARAGKTALRPIMPTPHKELVEKTTAVDIAMKSTLPVPMVPPQILSTIPVESITAASSVASQPIYQATSPESQATEPVQADAGGLSPMFLILGGLAALFFLIPGGSSRSKGAAAWA
jgi:hypothetical protein